MKNNAARLTALDGIRGIASLLIIIYHTSYDLSKLDIFHPFIRILLRSILLSGPLAVDIFFVLCGFLMAYLYPSVNNPLNFIQKRYLRIFPLFFATCIFSLVRLIMPDTHLILQFTILIIIGLLVHISLRYQLAKPRNLLPLKSFIMVILILQIIMIPANFTVGRLSMMQFDNLLAPLKYSIIFFGNLTLTLWAGWNIPILSGPYWSLAPEIIFYLAYPLIALAIFRYLKKSKHITFLVFLLLSASSFWYINELFNHFLALSRLNIIRSFGFVCGIIVALYYKNSRLGWNKIEKVIRKKIMSVFMISMFPFCMLILQFFSRDDQTHFIHTVTTSLLTFTIIAALVKGTLAYGFFNSRILRFFGLISYPAYLIHQNIIDMLKPFSHLNNLTDLFKFTFVVIFVTIPIAYILHILLERPYFQMKNLISNQNEK